MSRMLGSLVVLLVVLALAFLFLGKKARQLELKQAASAVASSASSPVAGGQSLAAPSAARPIGYGLTYGMTATPKPGQDEVDLSCGGEPRTFDRPFKDSCNPHQGDTSCRTVLPLACVRPLDVPRPVGDASAPNAAAPQLNLAATAAVMGAVLDSEASAHAMCERELGPGWSMAEYAEVSAGVARSLHGRKSVGLDSSYTRYWVLARNQPGNCWNSAP